MRRALVFGGTGQIGRALIGRLAALGVATITFARPGREEPGGCALDLADKRALQRAPLPLADVAFFCAGVSGLNACAADPASARRINVQAPALLFRRLADQGTRFIYLSSSSVFDGSRPLRETDEPTCPQTEYGRQKAEAEAALLAAGSPGLLVVRLTKVIAPGDRFDRWKADLLAGTVIRPFSDMPVAPVAVDAAAAVLAELAARGASGLRHVSAPRDITYAEAARRLADRIGAPRDLIRPRTVAEAGLRLEHLPRHTSLSTRSIRGLAAYRLLRPEQTERS